MENAKARFMRINDVSMSVGLATSTLFQMVREGRFLKPHKAGSRFAFWTEAEVLAWKAAVLGGLSFEEATVAAQKVRAGA